MKITDAMRKEVKGQGFLSNNDGKHFSCRVITENGAITADQLINVAEIAKKYGSGDISLTSRLTLEIPGIKYEDIENTKEHLKKDNLVSGGTGSIVRPIVPCKGTVCTFGLCDTQGIGTKLHKEFYEKWYDVKLPHKFKIGVGGCPNNCIKPSLNDFGVIGQFVPDFDEDMCSLSALLQWMWRSQIRNGKPIDIYIPSERMRELLNNWIQDCYVTEKTA